MATIQCPYCGKQLKHSPELTESLVQCPSCDGRFLMPSVSEASVQVNSLSVIENQTQSGRSSKSSQLPAPVRIAFGSVKRHPLREWYICTTIVGVILVIIGLRLPALFSQIFDDGSGLCLAIVALFLAALVKNFLDARFVDQQVQLANHQIRDLIGLNDVVKFLKQSSRSLFYDHVKNLYEISRRDIDVRQDNLVVLLQSRLYSRTKMTDLCSGLLVTLGLVGTIIGLIGAVSGLQAVMDSVGADQNSQLLSGMQQTMGGMGTAFYTTLFGALLGAVTLRLLANTVDTNVDYLVSHVAELSEVYIVPTLRRGAEKIKEKSRKSFNVDDSDDSLLESEPKHKDSTGSSDSDIR